MGFTTPALQHAWLVRLLFIWRNWLQTGKSTSTVINGVAYLHVINEPDSLGLACEVCQHCVELPSVNSFSMPNFPNYRLGHLEGSPCDTLRAPPVAAWGYEPGGLSVAFEDESYHDIRTWHWDFGDGATDSLPAPVHEYAAAGTYEVCLTVSNPRGSDTRCQVVEVVPSSSREAVAGRRLWVGPNPAKDELSIVWRARQSSKGRSSPTTPTGGK
jgi:PKD repeat protein